MAVGSGESLLASTAVEAIGIERIGDLRAALAATLVRQVADRPFFDAAFAAVMLAPPESGPPEVPVPVRSPRPTGACSRPRRPRGLQLGRSRRHRRPESSLRLTWSACPFAISSR